MQWKLLATVKHFDSPGAAKAAAPLPFLKTKTDVLDGIAVDQMGAIHGNSKLQIRSTFYDGPGRYIVARLDARSSDNDLVVLVSKISSPSRW